MLSDIELALHRKGTQRFIDSDPTVISLTRTQESWSGGSKSFSVQEQVEPQSFKVIWNGPESGIVSESEVKARRFDFVLVGLYDANIAIGDYWLFDDQYFQIEWIAPANGYQVKAGGVSHGSTPVAG